ncbi:MAG: DUF3795 domain-containing protein [Candidatus Bipolaricaulis sp.]|nr:DUF3795 domain-containing protein [Candidatus Bipolaricaulis sp.]
MLGYCGINCEECPAYQGTVTTDMSLLEKSAGSFWSGAYSAQEWVCLGCTPAEQPFLAKFCATCKIRVCAVGKGVPNCAACDGYESCALLHDFIKGESEVLCKRMEWLRGRFLAYKEERASRAEGRR